MNILIKYSVLKYMFSHSRFELEIWALFFAPVHAEKVYKRFLQLNFIFQSICTGNKSNQNEFRMLDFDLYWICNGVSAFLETLS